MAAYQAPPSLGFSRQEHWSGLPFPSPVMKVRSESEVAQSCPTLSDPMDCSLPGSSVHGIFQARVLEYCTIVINTTLEINYCYCCCCSVTKLCPILSDPMDCSPPGSSIHGIFQARILEWGAIAFSELRVTHI